MVDGFVADGSRETEGFRYGDKNFGGREHWDANTTNGIKQGISRDTDS